MKKIIYTASAVLLAFPALVSAQLVIPDPETAGGITGDDFYTILRRVLWYLLGIIAVLAIVGFVISGIMYITAAGDEDRVEKAKQMLTYSVIGLVVALLGLAIVTAVNAMISGGMTYTPPG